MKKTRFIRVFCIIVAALLPSFFPSYACSEEDTLVLVGMKSGMNQANAVSAYNRSAYVADRIDGVWVIDYSDPSEPASLTHYPEITNDIEIRDALAYLVGDCLSINRIMDPLQPETLGFCCCYDNHLKMHLFDDLALTMLGTPTGECYMVLTDVSDPYHPEALSITPPDPYGTQWGGDAFKMGNYVLWADAAFLPEQGTYGGRIIVLDITDPGSPLSVTIDTCLRAQPHAIRIKDDYAYVAEGYGGRGLMVLNVSDPQNIDSAGCFPIAGGEAWNVHLQGNYAYVCAHFQPTFGPDRIYVLDISDPSSPTLMAAYDTPGPPQDVFVDEPYVLVVEPNSLLILEANFLDMSGDVNGDGKVDIGDVVIILNYLFRHGALPNSAIQADVNGDCEISLEDAIYLLNYLFKAGNPPEIGCAF